MLNTVTIGKRLYPLEQIALVEPFDPAAQSRMQTDRTFQARVVLIDRESDDLVFAVTREVEMRQFRDLPRAKNNAPAFSRILGMTAEDRLSYPAPEEEPH